MPVSRQKIYWDTCIFLTWSKNEMDKPAAARQGIEETVKLFNKNEIILVTSVITRIEVFDCDFTSEQKNNF